MYFTGDDVHQNVSVVSPILNSLTLDNNKKGTSWISTGRSPEKIKAFDSSLASNLENGRVKMKFSNSILV